jgi:hypothetical protein
LVVPISLPQTMMNRPSPRIHSLIPLLAIQTKSRLIHETTRQSRRVKAGAS